jgi:hypothetical protein
MMRRSKLQAGLARALAAILSLLLSAQVAMSYVALETPLEAGHIRSVICGVDGFQTITINLATGEVEVIPTQMVQDHCPFCVVGAALLVPDFTPPQFAATFHFVPSEQAADLSVVPFRLWRAQAARAPPLSL